MTPRRARTRMAFTVVELLVVIAVIALLLSVLLPALGAARRASRSMVCLAHTKQLTLAWSAYTLDNDGRAMPLAHTDPRETHGGDGIYWFGADGALSGKVDRSKGFLAHHLGDAVHSVFECPDQPVGSYIPQGSTGEPTTTYGYNGYYLSPRHTPGWSFTIGAQPTKRISQIARPSELHVFGDTLLPSFGSGQPRSTALLDPPQLWTGTPGLWTTNLSPTTAFRHLGQATVAARADGSATQVHAQDQWLTHPDQNIGSVGTTNDPAYVPDWESW